MKQFLRRLPPKLLTAWSLLFRRPVLVIMLFPIIVATVLAIAYVGFTMSSAIRAYVGGESLWSKGQKAAVQSLYRFAFTHEDDDLQEYHRNLTVPLADRRARLELQSADPDLKRAARWFVIAQNHPADAENMAWLFVRFSSVSYMRRAIEIWTRGDGEIDSLMHDAEVLRHLVQSGARDPELYQATLARIAQTDARLTALEADFSKTLGEGARWMFRVIFTIVMLAGGTLVWIGMTVSHRLLQREAQLRQSQKMEAIGRLAGGVAHDFNNLLTVIIANIDMTLMELGGKREIDPTPLHDAHAAAGRAALLTDQLLAFSRQQILQPRLLRLDSCVADLRDMLARLIGDEIHLATELDSDIPLMNGDPGQIAQILLNLAVNARDAMLTGGTLTIRVYPSSAPPDTPPPTPLRRRDSAATWIVLEVSDMGVGMDAATRAQMFEPFFTTKGFGRGTGLGLSVVHGLVSQMGGQITVKSVIGSGTSFLVAFPAVSPDREDHPRKGTDELLPTENELGPTILLVEDDDALRSIIHRVLRNQGYTILDAANGADALDRIRARTPRASHGRVHLIISDVVMPTMGGVELIQTLGREGIHIPVIYISGYGRDLPSLIDTRGIRARFLAKPFIPDDLVALVRDTIGVPGVPKTVGSS